MITLNDIENEFGLRINKEIRNQINKWIDQPIPQHYIKKALKYELTDEEIDHIFEIGNSNGKYPRLYYLCFIYIHPLTYLQACVTTKTTGRLKDIVKKAKKKLIKKEVK